MILKILHYISMFFIGILIIPVRIYQYAISPFLPNSCRHTPTCSEYAIQSLKEHGVFTGTYLAVHRILRCNPWGTHGFDPVPPKGSVFHFKKWKKTGLSVWILVIALPLFIQCHSSKPKDNRPIVSVSVLPQEYLVKKIADSLVQINVMLPPGVSHASYEPLPLQMISLENSAIYFTIGSLGFEKIWLPRFLNSSSFKGKVVDLSTGIEVLESHESSDSDHDHGDSDPHYWMSPYQLKLMSKNVLDGLTDVFPSHETAFTENYNRLNLELDSLILQIRESLDSLPRRSFLIYHPALSYFCHDFNLTQIPVEWEGKNPDPRYLTELVDMVNQKGLKLMFIQKQFDRLNANLIEKETGIKLIEIDPLNPNVKDELLSLSKKIKEFI